MLKNWSIVFIGLALFAFSASAVAETDDDILAHILGASVRTSGAIVRPVKKDDALRLTSNKDEIIRLGRDAASVIVNNPEHASVMLDSPRLLIVMPRQPGTTSFSVLDNNGEVILRKDIIVTNVQPQYVRIRRVCNGTDPSCVPAAYYYCPDGCYEVTPVAPGGANSVPPPPVGASAAKAAATMGSAGLAPAAAPAPAPVPTPAPAANPVGTSNEQPATPGQSQ